MVTGEQSKDGVNHVQGLLDLVRGWDASCSAGADLGHPAPGINGNINVDGGAATRSAQVYAKSHPSFWSSIEEGIRPLVQCIAKRRGWVTYTSCEGHPAYGGTEIRVRHVGILPRTGGEAAEISDALAKAVLAAETVQAQAAVVRCRKVPVTFETGETIGLDLVFECDDSSWEAYRAACDVLQSAVIRSLDENGVATGR